MRAQDNQPTFVSRLHVRYDAAHFPEDLVFQETADQTTFQGRYVLRHPFRGTSQCAESARYNGELSTRQEKEAQNLAQLTGWNINDIRKKAQGSEDHVGAGASRGDVVVPACLGGGQGLTSGAASGGFRAA